MSDAYPTLSSASEILETLEEQPDVISWINDILGVSEEPSDVERPTALTELDRLRGAVWQYERVSRSQDKDIRGVEWWLHSGRCQDRTSLISSFDVDTSYVHLYVDFLLFAGCKGYRTHFVGHTEVTIQGYEWEPRVPHRRQIRD